MTNFEKTKLLTLEETAVKNIHHLAMGMIDTTIVYTTSDGFETTNKREAFQHEKELLMKEVE